jgi:hypothetical protein
MIRIGLGLEAVYYGGPQWPVKVPAVALVPLALVHAAGLQGLKAWLER